MVDESLLDWEANAHNIPIHLHMIAGSVAGITEHSLMFPFDTVKTSMQAVGS